ncbi:hemagglutinin repeat-containing protein [Roseibium salinum]|nr:hemagglutinin repeat-containing protein [Roseibium salinum]
MSAWTSPARRAATPFPKPTSSIPPSPPGGNLDIDAGRDLTLSGARAEAETADVNVGRNLTVESRLDTAEGSNKSAGFNAGVSVGFSTNGPPTVSAFGGVNGSKGSQSKAWVNEASGIVTEGALDVDVGEKTSVTGGVIASRSGELTLDTDTLETRDIALHDRSTQVSGGVNVSLGTSLGQGSQSGAINPGNTNQDGGFTPGVSIEGAYSNSEKKKASPEPPPARETSRCMMATATASRPRTSKHRRTKRRPPATWKPPKPCGPRRMRRLLRTILPRKPNLPTSTGTRMR